MIQQGADIIFPVAGPAGLGGLQAAQDADARGIWVDTDGCVSAAEYCDILLTSVMKGMDVAVPRPPSRRPIDGSSTTSSYVGTLENDGVGLAPFHERTPTIDQEVNDKIEELKAADHRRRDHDRSADRSPAPPARRASAGVTD